MGDKTFYYYFKENMNATPFVACPETLFGQFSTAVATISAMSNYVATYGTSATVSEMLFTISGSSTAAGGGIVGAATVTSEAGIAIAELGAAYYVGACIGSLFVAAVKCNLDSLDRAVYRRNAAYSVKDISCYAIRNGIVISPEVQKTLHRYPKLYQCH